MQLVVQVQDGVDVGAAQRPSQILFHDEQKLPDVVLLLQLFQPLTGDIVGTCLLRFRLHKGDG